MKKLTERFQLPLDAKLLLFVSPTEEKCVPAEENFWISNLQAPQAPWDSKKWPYGPDRSRPRDARSGMMAEAHFPGG